MQPTLARQALEFAQTIRLSHTLFALPFAVGTAALAEPPCPDLPSALLLLACLVTARTAAMGMNRVADAALDARNPRTADRAIPAGRLPRRVALALTLASGGAFLAAAWGFAPLRGNPWPGLLAPAFLALLLGYSWTKRVTALSHWVLGACLGLAPVGVWVALRGRLDPMPLLIGAAVTCWTGGFDVLYALQDTEVDRREGLHSVPARLGSRAARWIAGLSHFATLGLLLAVVLLDNTRPGEGTLGPASGLALEFIALVLIVQHWRSRRADAQEIARAFFPVNALVSIMWMAGVIVDAALAAGAVQPL